MTGTRIVHKALVLAVVLGLALFVLPARSMADDEGASFEQTARHVAIVYDDSGSMYYDEGTRKPLNKWYQANYMLQTFCALLGDQDSLFVTYMSELNPDPPNIMEGDRKAALDTIRSWQGYVSRTPFEAVESAYAHLKDLDKPSEDEYWLVIMTDGNFSDLADDLTVRLRAMIDEMAAASKTLKVVFFAIGQDIACPEADADHGLLLYRTDSQGIVSTMAEMSDVISARQQFPQDSITQTGDNTLTVSTRIPLRSLVVYIQGSAAPLQSAADSGGNSLKLSATGNIEAPPAFKLGNGIQLATDQTLTGSVTHITSPDGMLSPGDYTLTFADGTDGLSYRVLYEPAISLQLRYLVDGEEDSLPKNGEFVDIEALLVDTQGNPFDPELLQQSITCRLQEVRDGTVSRTVDGFYLDNVRLVDGRVSVVWEASMEGYFTVRGRMNYEAPPAGATPAPTATPEAASSPYGDAAPLSLVIGGTLPGQTIPLTRLEDAVVLVNPRYWGQAPTAEQAASGILNVECLHAVEFEVSYDAEKMTYSIRPRYYSGNSLITTVGPIQLLVQYTAADGATVTETVHFTIADMPIYLRYGKQLLIPVILLVLAVLISGILFLRPKFPRENAWLEYRQMVRNKKDQWALSMPPSRIDLKPSPKWQLVPFIAERINAAGLIVKASRSSQMVLIARQSLKPGISNNRGPLPESAMRKDYEMHSGTELYVEQGDVRQIYKLVAPKVTLIGQAQERSRRKSKKSKLGITIRRD